VGSSSLIVTTAATIWFVPIQAAFTTRMGNRLLSSRSRSLSRSTSANGLLMGAQDGHNSGPAQHA
jgi:hypothetical protein